MNKLTEDEGQVQPKGRGTSIEGVAHIDTFFSVIKKNLDINSFLCAIKINKNYCFIKLSNIHGAYKQRHSRKQWKFTKRNDSNF